MYKYKVMENPEEEPLVILSIFAPKKYNDATVKQMELRKFYTGYPMYEFYTSHMSKGVDNDDEKTELMFHAESKRHIIETFYSLCN